MTATRSIHYIASPLRYPGGKSKAIGQILPHLPKEFTSYREPFVGGGSLFIYLKQLRPELPVWINDVNYDLYCFWKQAQLDVQTLASEVLRIKQDTKDGRELFKHLTADCSAKMTDFQRAVRFFVLNRITFSGTVDAGGYSEQAFKRRFTDSSIKRLSKLADVLQKDVRITNLDYADVLQEGGDNGTFILGIIYNVSQHT